MTTTEVVNYDDLIKLILNEKALQMAVVYDSDADVWLYSRPDKYAVNS